jgi:hypothetical protein
MRRRTLFFLGVLSAACGSSTPTNFAGSYNLALVDGPNDCNVKGWNAGAAANVPATITQDNTYAQLTVAGGTLTGDLLALFLGSNSFPATVDGDVLTANYLGPQPQTLTGTTCTYHVRIQLNMTLDAQDQVTGQLSYVPVTTGDPSCGVLNSCTNTQTVAGSRVGP